MLPRNFKGWPPSEYAPGDNFKGWNASEYVYEELSPVHPGHIDISTYEEMSITPFNVSTYLHIWIIRYEEI